MDVYVRTVITPHLGVTQRGETQHKIIDWNDSSDRKWLMTHLHWAMCNKKPVTMEQANGYHREVTRQHLQFLEHAARSN
jgi:hypothetical protein